MNSKKKKIKRYDLNKQASVGDELVCPVCGKKFTKKSYQQAFCSTFCKDKYWNQKRRDKGYFKRYNIDHPERLERIGIYMDEDHSADYALGDPEWESLGHITVDNEMHFLRYGKSKRYYYGN